MQFLSRKMELLDYIFGEEESLVTPDEGLAEYKKRKSDARARMLAMQRQPYELKKQRSEIRAREFIEEMDKRLKSAHVSVGGLDSIVLYLFLTSIGIEVPAISVSSLEDKSIQKVHRAFGIHMEERPHRFDRLRERNPKEWEFWMYRCCTDEDTGEQYGWGRVLDYIGVSWEDIPARQMRIEDFLEEMA